MNDGPTARAAQSDWIEYKRTVLDQLLELGKDIKQVAEKVETIRTEDLLKVKLDIALLKFQAALWGALGGSILTGITLIVVKFLVK